MVLQVDSEYVFVQEEDEVDSVFPELLKQQSQCRFRDMVYSMSEKTQFPGFMFPRVMQRR